MVVVIVGAEVGQPKSGVGSKPTGGAPTKGDYCQVAVQLHAPPSPSDSGTHGARTPPGSPLATARLTAYEDSCRTCIGSAAGGGAAGPQTAAVIILIEDVEDQASNSLVFDAAKTFISRLSPNDLIGFPDSAAKPLAKLQPAGDDTSKNNLVKQFINIGDPGSYEPYVREARDMLANRPEVKQVILMGDGDASSPPPELLSDMTHKGIAVNTVGVDIDHSPDQMNAMRQIAVQGNGRFFGGSNVQQAANSLVTAAC